MGDRITYRELKKYKYELLNDYSYATGVDFGLEQNVVEPPSPRQTYLRLDKNGHLHISRFYAWDGPSGPTIDTKNFMRGSLVHDALYQLLRRKRIDARFRKDADLLLRDICRADGMSAFRAWYVYQGVRLGGAWAARPDDRDEFAVIEAP